MSLDGYIADTKGGVGWLHGQGPDSENPDTYGAFAKGIDTVLMGWNTYHQVVTELSPGEWIYGDFMTYVFTHQEQESTGRISFTGEDPAGLVRRLTKQEGKDIWICGGAKLAGQLMKEGLIDQYYISLIPTILGGGIRLFGDMERERRLKLLKTRNYNGIVELIYEKCGRSEEK